ncbi:MAG: sigma 54-interacting transcriptional regulator [Myxococcota bacterium]
MSPNTSPPIIGRSPGLRRALDHARRVAPFDLPVLLHGETGTGKEGLAHYIHERSDRYGPLVPVNCADLTDTLVSSQLFGHERGAFTGADRQHRGFFEQAHRGTLFLDEIGDLPRGAQARLLRTLQEGTVRRVGATADVAVDVRIVAATHKDLPAMVRDGSFREDLYHRIAGLVIELPPLRERETDVLLLADHFFRTERAVRDRKLTQGARRVLLAREWPGNIRELRSFLLRAAILEDGPITLGAGDVDPTDQVVRLLRNPKSSGELRRETGMARSTLNRVLLTLEQAGRIVRTGEGRATAWSAT